MSDELTPNNRPTAVSLFAGVGGFDLALERNGFNVVAACEIDKNARGVLARHFPNTKLFNDVRELTGDDLRAAGFVADGGIITGGFPCQDLSVAGKRLGFTGQRSSLFYQIARLADETKAEWLLLENVPGLLTSQRGADMGAVVGTLVELGYGVSWRVLDAQYFGVPQRRRRVFIVARRFGDVASCAQVLFEPESLRGDYPSSGASGEETPRGIGQGVESATRGGNTLAFDTQFGSNANVFENISPTLKASQASPSFVDADPVLAFDEMNFSTSETHHTLRAGTKQSTGVVEETVYGRGGFGSYSEGGTTLTATSYKRTDNIVVGQDEPLSVVEGGSGVSLSPVASTVQQPGGKPGQGQVVIVEPDATPQATLINRVDFGSFDEKPVAATLTAIADNHLVVQDGLDTTLPPARVFSKINFASFDERPTAATIRTAMADSHFVVQED